MTKKAPPVRTPLETVVATMMCQCNRVTRDMPSNEEIRAMLPRARSLITTVREDAEVDNLHKLLDKLSNILTRTANALKGPPERTTLHDWSDLPVVAAALRKDVRRIAMVLKPRPTMDMEIK